MSLLLTCVFLGYSTTKSAYLCLEPSSSHIYTSRHVKFVESIFPFKFLHLSLDCPSSQTMSHWCPPVSFISITSISMTSTTTEPSHFPYITVSNAMPATQNFYVHNPTTSPTLPSIPPLKTQHPPPPPRVIVTHSRNNIFKPLTKLNLTT